MDFQAPDTHAALRHAVILCHPEPASFSHAVAAVYAEAVRNAGHEVLVRDLYAIGFDPILKAHERPTLESFRIGEDVEREIALLRECDVFVLVYPIWFGTPPAMLKGYVERVLGSGIKPHDVQRRARKSFLAGKRLVSFTTSAGREPWLSDQGQWLSLRYLFDHYLTHAFGMLPDEHVHCANVVTGMPKLWADRHLHQVGEQARRTCSMLLAERHRSAALAGQERVSMSGCRIAPPPVAGG